MKTRSKLAAVLLWKCATNQSEVRTLYLVTVDYGVETLTGLSKNQLVVHLC